MLTRSIRWRMQLWQAFLLVCVLSGFGVTAYQLHRTNRLSQVDRELERRVAALSSDVRGRPPFPPPGEPFRSDLGPPPQPGVMEELGPPPEPPPFDRKRGSRLPRRLGLEFRGRRGGPEDWHGPREVRLSDRTLSLFEPSESEDFYYAVWSRDGTLLKRATNGPPEVPFPAAPEGDTGVHARGRGSFREAFHFTEMGDCVLAGRSITSDLKGLRRFAWWLACAGGAVLTLGLGGGWLLASRSLRPIEHISSAASRISAGSLSERISIADTDSELGRLAGVLNSTFARLEAAFAQQKQFTADASHELRTPIAVLISEAQTTLARDRSAAEYRETVEACLEVAQQMRQLTQSLLELARYDAGQEPLEHRPVDLAERTRASVDLVRPLAQERRIEIHCDLQPAVASGDADRLGQVLINLLTNAIFYNKEKGEVRASTRTEAGAVVLTVADSGPGIAPEDLPHIFERFYRADKARGRAEGRSGLGLAICKAIVEAHGGSLGAASQPGAGATFTVRLPAERI